MLSKKRITFFIIFNLIIVHKKIYASNIRTSNQTIIQNNKKGDKNFIFSQQLDTINKLYNQENYKTALSRALKLLSSSDPSNNEHNRSINFLIANIFRKTKNHQKAIKYYKKSIQYFQNNFENKNNTRVDYLKTAINIGSEFQKMKKNDSAIFYYNKILNSKLSITSDYNSLLAKTYANLSGLYLNQSDVKKAKEFILKSISLYNDKNNGVKDKVLEASALNNLAGIYLLERNYKKAKEVYTKGLNLIERDKSGNAINFKQRLYYNLAWTHYLLKDYKAYDFQEKSYLIKDSIRDSEINRIVGELYIQHKENLELQKVNLAREQRKLAETQESKTNLLFGALSLLVIGISGVVVYNYKLRQKNLQLKLSENSLLQQQSIEKLKSEAHTKILNAAIDGKESERKQIAEILHDNVSALLSSANMHLSATKKQCKNKVPPEIDKTQAIILEASQKVRDLSHNLISSILLKFGLEYALKDVVKKYSNSQLKFEVSANNINRYNQEFEIRVFNIIQELINNIIKHSKASGAKLVLQEEKRHLTILVKDDGVGFSTSSSSSINTNDGIGLSQIAARIEMMNGKLDIASKINSGTSILITLPIKKQKQVHQFSSVS